MATNTLGRRFEAVSEGGAGKFGIGEMPLTLFIIVAVVIVYLHLSGGSRAAVAKPAARVNIPPGAGPPVLPPAGEGPGGKIGTSPPLVYVPPL